MQRYFAEKLLDDYFVLKEEDKYHIKTVMRMSVKEKIEVIYNNKLYIAYIEDIKNLKIKLLKEEKINIDKIPHVTLCIPLLKEQKMDYILQKATELGVKKIIPIILERSIIKLDDNKIDKKIERWNKIVKEASEQSKRVDIPKISRIHTLSELNYEGLKIVCSTINKDNSIKNILKNHNDNIIFVIGPEGGLTDYEESLLKNMGYIQTSLGNRIMRVETVPLYLMSVINYEYME